MMRGREAVRLHLFHRFLCAPSFLGHSICCDHHSGAVIAGLAVDKNLLAPIVAKQSEKSSHVCVLRVEAVPGNRHEAHSKLGHLLALDFAASLPEVHYDSDAHLNQFLKSFLGRLRAAIQGRANLAQIRHSRNSEFARNRVLRRDKCSR